MTAIYLAIVGFAAISAGFGFFVLRNPHTPAGSRLATKGSMVLMAGTLINIAPSLFGWSESVRYVCMAAYFICIVIGCVLIKQSFRATAALRAKTLADAEVLRQARAPGMGPFDSP